MKAMLIMLWLLVFSATSTIVATIYFHELIASVITDNSGNQAKVAELTHQLDVANEQLKLASQREQMLLTRVEIEEGRA